MSCPSCNAYLTCNCRSCLKRHGERDSNMVTVSSDGFGWVRACPKCGFKAGEDEWLDIEVQQAKDAGLWPK